MTNTTMDSLQQVQKLDERISELEEAIRAFEPQLAEIEEPALALESELASIEKRLAEMQADTRRLDRNADDKRARIKKLEERLNKVQNLREEAAVRTELDLVRKAVDADEQEALQLMGETQRAEQEAEELREKAEAARAEVEPSQEALMAERQALEEELEALEAQRQALLEDVGDRERKVYDSFHNSGRSVVVAALLPDGACGHCFGVVPLQVQNEIRHSSAVIRCEACGVILSADLETGGDDEADSETGEG